MKKYLFLLLAAFALVACESEPYHEVLSESNSSTQQWDIEELNDYRVSHEVAVERAIKAINDLKEMPQTRTADLRVSKTQVVRNRAKTRTDFNIDTLFYLINFEDNQGFALIAADERNTDVFMLAEEGSLDVEHLEPNSPMNYFLDCATGYATYELLNSPRIDNEIIVERDTNFLEPGTPRDYPLMEYDGVLYHCKTEIKTYTYSSYTITEWHQGAPYNNKCFTDDNQPAVAGCVAIAMAQIMAFHQHPDTYNWDDMLISATVPPFYVRGVEAVSTLVADIGEAVDMNYGVNSSSSNINCAASAFYFTFNYAFGSVRNYDVNIVLNNITARQPVYVRGFSDTNEGHAWVIDGVKYDVCKRTYYDRETLQPAIFTENLPDNFKVRNNVGWAGCPPIWTTSGLLEYYGENFSFNNKILESVKPIK